MLIQDIFEKDIRRTIDGVIKADDERHLANEVTEYVLTPDIRAHLSTLLESYNAGGTINGVWISGFFGSGKSHLLKMISLLLENRQIDNLSVAESFAAKIKDDSFLIGEIKKATRVPTRSILFNIDQRVTERNASAILQVFVNVFNELRGYDKLHGWIADLEATLDEHGHYESFKSAFHAEMGGAANKTWDKLRGQAAVLFNRQFAAAYAVATGVSHEEASRVLKHQSTHYKVNIESFAERVNSYIETQPKGFRLNFFVDEVGQFIGDDTHYMLNLQTIAESLSTKCSGRAWIFVTSQGNLETVLGAWKNTKGDDFSKIQGRFKTQINLTSKDVDQVICHRLLEKKSAARPELTKLYSRERENLRTLFVFSEDMAKFKSVGGEDDFTARYPFMPYQFDLFEQVLKEFSNQNWFTGKHSSIGERSMLGVFQEVAKKIADKPAGKLATFDIMFEGLRSVLRGDLQTRIQQAEGSFGVDDLKVRLLKVLFLVKHCQFSSKPRNLAILLIDDCGIPIAAHEKAVTGALDSLAYEGYIRRSGEKFEFLTNEEKDLENEIRSTSITDHAVAAYLSKTLLGDIIAQAKLRYEDLGIDYDITRRFDNSVLGREHDIGIHLIPPGHPIAQNSAHITAQSLTVPNELLIPLAFDDRLLDDITTLLKTEAYQSKVSRPDLSPAKQALLNIKATEINQLRVDIRTRLVDAVSKSPVFLAGNKLDLPSADPKTRLAKAFQELVKSSYRHLQMIRAKVTEDDVRRALNAPTNELFAGNDTTLSESENEILRLLREEKHKGREVTAKTLFDTLEKRPYGWRFPIPAHRLARLIRRGKIELRSQSQPIPGQKIAEALLGEKAAADAVILLQEDYDASTIKEFKEFHHDLFGAINHGIDAGDVVRHFQTALAKRLEEIRPVLLLRDQFAFYAPLEKLNTLLNSLITRERDYYFRELRQGNSLAESILDAKESSDGIFQFHAGEQRPILVETRAFLRNESASLHELPADKVALLRALADAVSLPPGSAFVTARNTLAQLREELGAKIESARSRALESITDKAESARQLDDYSAIPPAEAGALVAAAIEGASAPIRESRSLADITRLTDEFHHRGFSVLMSELHTRAQLERFKYTSAKTEDISAPVKEPKPTDTVQFIHAKKVKTGWTKPALENLDDLDAYLDALRAAYAAELKQKKRIQL